MSAKIISGVIFDFDGLLVDSEPVQEEAWKRYLAGFDAALSPELLDRMYGRRLVDASQVVVDVLGLPVTAEVVARDRDALFLEMVPGRIKPTRGATALLAELIEREIPIALATSGHRRYVDLALEGAGIERNFTVEVTGDLVKQGKPHPETFLTAATMLDVRPEECLVLEDSPNGLLAAKAAGMYCFVVPGSTDSRHDYSSADLILSSLNDVIPAMEAHGFCFSSGSQG